MMARVIRTDQGALYDVTRELPDGWMLLESWRHRVRAYARITGRVLRPVPGGGVGRRVALHRAEDIGLVRFQDVTETLRPGELVGRGWTLGW